MVINHLPYKKNSVKLKFPVVIKPLNEGSSVNVFICNKSNLTQKVKSLKDYKKIMFSGQILIWYKLKLYFSLGLSL